MRRFSTALRPVRRCGVPRSVMVLGSAGAFQWRGVSSQKSTANLGDQMRSSGFVNSTPNFDVKFDDMPDTAELAKDIVSSPATGVDFVREMHGPWLVMTSDLQGELFVDQDRFVFYRPANGLGYGIGKIETHDAGEDGTAFHMDFEVYTYAQTDTSSPKDGRTYSVTGMVQRVRSVSSQYETLSLAGLWARLGPEEGGSGSVSVDEDNKDEGATSGNFNAAKLSPWDPATAKRWTPNAELLDVFNQVFPKSLVLTSHRERAKARAAELAAIGKTSGGKRGIDLEKYKIGSIPGLYYIPDYISEDEERQMLDFIKQTPKELKNPMKKRTVQEWGCTMCEECQKSFVADFNLPPWVQSCSDMLVYDGIFTPSTFPNSVRIHEYEKGEGIGPHCDGPIYVPNVTVLSLASTCVMNFYPRRDPYADTPMEHYNDTFKFKDGEIGKLTPVESVVLEPRSLLIFSGDAYYYHPHGVSDEEVSDLSPEFAGEVTNRHLLRDPDIQKVERQYRASLTTRNLLARCNHQPDRAEYAMKRAWYLYRHEDIPEPLFALPNGTTISATTTSAGAAEGAAPNASHGMSSASAPVSQRASVDPNIQATLRQVLKEQEAIRQSLAELREMFLAVVAQDAAYKKETSTVLNLLSSSVLDLDSKVEDIADAVSDKS